MDGTNNCHWGCGIHTNNSSFNNLGTYWCDPQLISSILAENDSWVNYKVQYDGFCTRVIFDRPIEIKNGETCTIRHSSRGDVVHVKITKSDSNIADWLEEAEINQEQTRLNNEATELISAQRFIDLQILGTPLKPNWYNDAKVQLNASAAAHDRMAEKQKLRDKVKKIFEVRRKLFSSHHEELMIVSLDAMENEILRLLT